MKAGGKKMSDLFTQKVKHAAFLKNALLKSMEEASFLRCATLGHDWASEKMHYPSFLEDRLWVVT